MSSSDIQPLTDRSNTQPLFIALDRISRINFTPLFFGCESDKLQLKSLLNPIGQYNNTIVKVTFRMLGHIRLGYVSFRVRELALARKLFSILLSV